MKRCPQCEFVYEDEQQLCDMDRAELVFDLSFLTESVSAPVAVRPIHWTRLSSISVIAAVMSAALSFVYFATLTQVNERAGKQLELPGMPVKAASAPGPIAPELTADTATALPTAPAGEISAAHEADSRNRKPIPESNARAGEEQGTAGKRNHRTGSEQSSPSKIVGPITRVTTARMTDNGAAITTRSDGPMQTTLRGPSVRAQAKPGVVEQKKESRLGSFLKTTGRILRKPFKP